MEDNSVERMINYLNPKVRLTRLDIPLNATIKIKDIPLPLKSKVSSTSNGKTPILNTSIIIQKVPGESKIDNVTKKDAVEENSSERLEIDNSPKTVPVSSKTMVKRLMAGSKIKMPSKTMIRMISSGTKIRKMSSGMVVKKVSGAMLKRVSSKVLMNKTTAGTKIKMMSIGNKVRKAVSNSTLGYNTLHNSSMDVTQENEDTPSKTPDVTPSSEKKETVSENTTEPSEVILNELESDCLKSDSVEDTSAFEGVGACDNLDNSKKKQTSCQVNVSSMNGNNNVIQKVRKQSSNLTTPVRISARLKNRKEKFSVKKLLDGTSYFDRFAPKKQVMRNSKHGKLPLSVKVNNLATKFHMTKSQFVKTVLAAREKIMENNEKLKPAKPNTFNQLDFSVELGPEITVTRVKNSKSSVQAKNKNKEDSIHDIVTITEGKLDSKKINSVSKVTQTYSSGKLKEDQVELCVIDNNLNVKNNNSEKQKEIGGTVTNSQSSESNERVNDESKQSDIPETEIRDVLKMKQQKRFVKQQSVEADLQEKSQRPGQCETFSKGKKTAKVTPLTQVKGLKNENHATKTAETVGKLKPVKLSKLMPRGDADEPLSCNEMGLKGERSPPALGRVPKTPVKQKSEDNFEKFFITKTRVCEHNDSLDSESEEEVKQLSHFINMKSNEVFPPQEAVKNVVKAAGSSKESTIYDLIQDISLELPAWNLHILQDTNSFCIAHVARGPVGIPVMKKMIEIDTDYNAKVYVNQAFRSEFHGVYDTYESIRDLILTLDQL